MRPDTEAIIYIARKLHWSREEIGQFTLSQLRAVIDELTYQESLEAYQKNYQVALILSAIYNTIPTKSRKTYKPNDFLSAKMPQREKEMDIPDIKLPNYDLKERENG